MFIKKNGSLPVLEPKYSCSAAHSLESLVVVVGSFNCKCIYTYCCNFRTELLHLP